MKVMTGEDRCTWWVLLLLILEKLDGPLEVILQLIGLHHINRCNEASRRYSYKEKICFQTHLNIKLINLSPHCTTFFILVINTCVKVKQNQKTTADSVQDPQVGFAEHDLNFMSASQEHVLASLLPHFSAKSYTCKHFMIKNIINL